VKGSSASRFTVISRKSFMRPDATLSTPSLCVKETSAADDMYLRALSDCLCASPIRASRRSRIESTPPRRADSVIDPALISTRNAWSSASASASSSPSTCTPWFTQEYLRLPNTPALGSAFFSNSSTLCSAKAERARSYASQPLESPSSCSAFSCSSTSGRSAHVNEVGMVTRKRSSSSARHGRTCTGGVG